MDKIKNAAAIYALRCTVNNKCYVGATKHLQRRLYQHFARLRSGRHENKRLNRDLRKHGEDAFVVEVLEWCDDPRLRPERERVWMARLKTLNPRYGYNILGVSSPTAML